MTTLSAPAEPEAEPEANPFGDDGGERTSVANIAQLEQLRDQARVPASAPKKPVQLDVSAQWFAMVKGAQSGPYDPAALATKFHSGELHARSYLWKQGMGEWKRADEIAELAPILNPPAPAAPVAPPPPPPAPPKVAAAPERVRIAEPVRELEQAQPEPEPEPEPSAPAPAPRPSLETLFSDEDLPPPESPSPKRKKQEEIEDPFAALGGTLDPNAAPAPGEATRFFMQQAGVSKGQRNPPWKIALFVLLLIGLPIGALYLLSELHVVPLQISSVNDKGEEVKTSVFSGAGVKGLGDLLLGKNKKPKEQAPIAVTPPVKKNEPGAKKQMPAPEKDPNQPSQEELAALYQDDRMESKGPKLRIAAEQPSFEKSAGGLGEEEVVKVVGQSQPAFQGCIEAELKKNPNLKVGKIVISATVAPSGAVTRAEIDKREVAMSNLGECLKTRARRMVFARFDGEETELQIPLMVTSSF